MGHNKFTQTPTFIQCTHDIRSVHPVVRVVDTTITTCMYIRIIILYISGWLSFGHRQLGKSQK